MASFPFWWVGLVRNCRMDYCLIGLWEVALCTVVLEGLIGQVS